MQLKLDELLRAGREAKNAFINLEELTAEDLRRIKQRYATLQDGAAAFRALRLALLLRRQPLLHLYHAVFERTKATANCRLVVFELRQSFVVALCETVESIEKGGFEVANGFFTSRRKCRVSASSTSSLSSRRTSPASK